LAGDTLDISANNFNGEPTGTTVNLSHDASVTALLTDGAHATFNLAGGVSHLDATYNDAITASSVTVDLAANAIWIGTFDISYGSHLNTAAGAHAVFINDGASGFGTAAGGVFNMPVAGTGSIGGYESRIEFASSVGAGQTIEDEGGEGTAMIVIDKPYEFHGLVQLYDFSELDLVGLAHADSYTLKNDMLKLYSGNRVIYDMRLDAVPYGGVFAVAQTPAGVSIYTSADPNNLPAGALPVHG